MDRHYPAEAAGIRPARRRAGLGRKRLALGLDPGGQHVPVLKAKDFGDQFKALAVGEGNGFGVESFAQCLRHSLGVAEIAHDMILCINKRKTSVACVADPFAWAKESDSIRYIHRTPGGAQAAGCIRPRRMCATGPGLVNRPVWRGRYAASIYTIVKTSQKHPASPDANSGARLPQKHGCPQKQNGETHGKDRVHWVGTDGAADGVKSLPQGFPAGRATTSIAMRSPSSNCCRRGAAPSRKSRAEVRDHRHHAAEFRRGRRGRRRPGRRDRQCQARRLIMDMSTVDPGHHRCAGQKPPGKGIAFVDAPVGRLAATPIAANRCSWWAPRRRISSA